MQQTWHDLLFAHWPVSFEQLRPLVPAQLSLDTFDGQCWIGVVPFWMSGVRSRGLPPVPGLSRFPELNVRTYVTHDEKPGVYFFSLDAANLPAVWGARAFYHLPYFWAAMKVIRQNGPTIIYRSSRRKNPAEFHAVYSPNHPIQLREKGSLEHWFTERYCLYTVHQQRVFRCDIHHLPWPLQDAEAEILKNTVASPAGIILPATKPQLQFAERLDVLIWPLRSAD